MNNILVELCDYDNKFIINNIYPLYLYDLGEIRNIYPNSYGVFEDDDSVKTIEFWRKTLSKYTKDQFTEEDKDIPEYEFGKVFKFSNGLSEK